MYDTNDSFIFTVSGILTGNQVNSQAVSKSLKLICDNFSFCCGAIYETDFSEQFCLMEHYAPSPTSIPQNFSSQTLSAQEQASLSNTDLHCIKRKGNNTPLERLLLDFHSANLLVLAPVTDENHQIYGLVLFFCTNEDDVPEFHLPILSASLSILVRYVAIRMYHRKLRQSQTTLQSILDNTGIDIYVNDFYTHEILYVNKSMAAPYGGQDQFMKRKCWAVLFPGQTGPCEFCPQTKLIDEHGNPTKVYSWDYQRAFDGSWFRVFSSAFHWIDGRIAHVVSSADITENKRNEAIIEKMANYDELTGLPNRRMLVKECERRIDNATATEQGYLLFFDIDGFKSINDTLGHDAGDEFLIQLGKFFSKIPLLQNSIYRNGGDEFVAIVGGEGVTKDNIRNLASFIHQRFQQPWNLEKGQIFCNTSIGVACYPEDGTTVDPLLQKADMAMYRTKKSGGAGISFGYELDENA